MSNPILDEALNYANNFDWAVFPLIPRDKKPLTPNGYHDATKNPNNIKSFWEKWPNANIGIVTGDVSGFWVLDIDGEIGQENLDKLQDFYGELPQTRIIRTGGGGLHYYFQNEPEYTIQNSAGKIAKGIDVRGNGGYVVAPPSVHETGNFYVTENASPIVKAPTWLIELISKDHEKKFEPSNIDYWHGILLGNVTEGSRNDTLAHLAGHLFSKNDPILTVFGCLEWNRRACNPPLPEDEVLRTINSIAKSEVHKWN